MRPAFVPVVLWIGIAVVVLGGGYYMLQAAFQ